MSSTAHRAVFALGRLFEAFDGSAVAEAWAARSRIEAVVRLLHADGLGIDRERVLRLAYDLPVGGHLGLGNDTQVLQIIAVLGGRAEGGAGPGGITEELAEAEADFLSRADGAALGALLGGLWQWLSVGRRPSAGHIAFIRCLEATGLAPAPLGVLARPSGPIRQSQPVWIEETLARLADTADTARGDLGSLSLTVTEWRRRLGHRRRNSRMDVLIDAVASMLVVSPAAIARRLGLSLRGASQMLEELAALGIVNEVTGRKSWKVFVPGDLVISAPDQHGRRQEIPPAGPLTRPPDLTPLLEDAGSAIARVQAAMARLRSGRERTNETDSPDEDEPVGDQPTRRS